MRRGNEILASVEQSHLNQLPPVAADRLLRAKSELFLFRLQLLMLEQKWTEVPKHFRSALSSSPHQQLDPSLTRYAVKTLLAGAASCSDALLQPFVQETLLACLELLHHGGPSTAVGGRPPVSPRSDRVLSIAVLEQLAHSSSVAGQTDAAQAYSKKAVDVVDTSSTLHLWLKMAVAAGDDAAACESLFRLVQHASTSTAVALHAIETAWASTFGQSCPDELLQAYVLLMHHPSVASNAAHAAQVQWRYAEALSKLRRPGDLKALLATSQEVAPASERYGRWYFLTLAAIAEELMESADETSAQDENEISQIGLELCRVASARYFMYGDVVELSRILTNVARLELVSYSRNKTDVASLTRAAQAADDAASKDPTSPHAALIRFQILLLQGRVDASRHQLQLFKCCEPRTAAAEAFHVAAVRSLELHHYDICHEALDAVLQNVSENESCVAQSSVSELSRVYVSCIMQCEPLLDTHCDICVYAERSQLFVPKIARAAQLASRASDVAKTCDRDAQNEAWWWAGTLETLGRCLVQRIASLSTSLEPQPAATCQLPRLVRLLFEQVVQILNKHFVVDDCDVSTALLRKILSAQISFLAFAWAGKDPVDPQAVGRLVSSAKVLARRVVSSEEAAIRCRFTRQQDDELAQQGDDTIPPQENADLREALRALRDDSEINVIIAVVEIEVAMYSICRPQHEPDRRSSCSGPHLSSVGDGVARSSAGATELCLLIDAFSSRSSGAVQLSHIRRLFACATSCAEFCSPGETLWPQVLFALSRAIFDFHLRSRLDAAALQTKKALNESQAEADVLHFLRDVKVHLDLCPHRKDRVEASRKLYPHLLPSDAPRWSCIRTALLATEVKPSGEQLTAQSSIAFVRYMAVEWWNDHAYYHNLGQDYDADCHHLRLTITALVDMLPPDDDVACAIRTQLLVVPLH